MEKKKYTWLWGAGLMVILIAVPLLLVLPGHSPGKVVDPWDTVKTNRTHLDHSNFFKSPFMSPQEVTKACLECHENAAADLMKTAHWKWEGDPVHVEGHDEPMRIGKKNLINNFCIGIRGNWASCTSCHAGYGWGDANFDFTKQENVDCLVCHDWSGLYVKDDKGLPKKEVDLTAVAKSVGYPKRDNCGMCHIYGGGGMGVKHGDLDNTLVNPAETLDIHMGQHNLLCIDCHKTKNHNITGRAFSVGVNHENGINCTDCHADVPHKDRRINAHLSSVACSTCHIPTYAKKAPTKTDWDWSKAGDLEREDHPHEYLKIKGEFIYDKDVVPEYYWFNLKANRYILGDKIDPSKTTKLNQPMGGIEDKDAKIWPFKVHRGIQPYDKEYNYILQPVTSGAGGFWYEFDWDKALRLGAGFTGIKYSGNYGFTRTTMFWPLSHMVPPTDQTLKCHDCHSENSRMDWKALGYKNDPAKTGPRMLDDPQPNELK